MCEGLSHLSTYSLHFVITYIFFILQHSPTFSQQINVNRPEIVIYTSEERGGELKIKFEINQINKILEEGESPYGSEYSG